MSRRTLHAFLRELKSRSESSSTIAILYGWKWRSSRRILLTVRSASLRADACLRAERRGDEVLIASIFSGDLMDQGTPVLRLVALAVSLNIVTHVIIDFRSETEANGTKLKRFRKVCWVEIIEYPLEK